MVRGANGFGQSQTDPGPPFVHELPARSLLPSPDWFVPNRQRRLDAGWVGIVCAIRT